MDTRNPIVQMVKSTNLKVKDFCILFDCSLNSMRLTTAGHADKIPKNVLGALRRAGFDVTDIDQKYKEWQLMTAKERAGGNVL